MTEGREHWIALALKDQGYCIIHSLASADLEPARRQVRAVARQLGYRVRTGVGKRGTVWGVVLDGKAAD